MSKDTIVNAGRKHPSQEALERFAATYKRMVKENQEREAMLAQSQASATSEDSH
ncbi:hypothetical protein [Bacillus suaedae]|uniref:Uncharacterized protein n=1 Tax=Halalkalibacter suaedae TaxID=2822140 RepID=A0A940WVB8_9BACI|nr:hypothetical protein [Bacillus suaedae]MBP3951157.1 hypothetical protein [Bacillus suaedae]